MIMPKFKLGGIAWTVEVTFNDKSYDFYGII